MPMHNARFSIVFLLPGFVNCTIFKSPIVRSPLRFPNPTCCFPFLHLLSPNDPNALRLHRVGQAGPASYSGQVFQRFFVGEFDRDSGKMFGCFRPDSLSLVPPRVKEDAETQICCSQTRSVQDTFVARTLPRSGVFNNLDEPHDSKGSIHLFEGKGG